MLGWGRNEKSGCIVGKTPNGNETQPGIKVYQSQRKMDLMKEITEKYYT